MYRWIKGIKKGLRELIYKKKRFIYNVDINNEIR